MLPCKLRIRLMNLFALSLLIALPAFALTREGSENASEADVATSLRDGSRVHASNRSGSWARSAITRLGLEAVAPLSVDEALQLPDFA